MKISTMRSRDNEGPQLHLHDWHMQRLNLDPSAEDEIEFHGRAKVRSTDESTGPDGTRRHAILEITHMGADHKGGPSVRETLANAAKDKD